MVSDTSHVLDSFVFGRRQVYGLGICACSSNININTITVGPQSDTEAASDSGHDASDSAHGASKSGCPSGDTGNSGHDSAHGAACPSGNSGHDSVSRSSHVVTDSDPVCPSTNVVHNSSGTGESGRHEAGYDRGKTGYSASVHIMLGQCILIQVVVLNLVLLVTMAVSIFIQRIIT